MEREKIKSIIRQELQKNPSVQIHEIASKHGLPYTAVKVYRLGMELKRK